MTIQVKNANGNTVTISTIDDLLSVVGTANSSPTSYTMLDRLKQIHTDLTGTLSVNVGNYPASQNVVVTSIPSVNVGNFPATQTISGNVIVTSIPTVNVGNFPANVSITALPSVSVSNLPSSQNVIDQTSSTHAPAYYQVTVTTSANSLVGLIGASIPSWATMAYITPETGMIRYRADGTSPTASIGQPIQSGQVWPIQGSSALSAVQFIASGSRTVSIEFRG